MSARPRPERHAEQVLARFPVERVILVADRGLLSLDNIAELSTWPRRERKLQIHPGGPGAALYAELGGTLVVSPQNWRSFAEQRLVVAPRSRFAQPQSARRGIKELEVFAEELVAKLDAQDEGRVSAAAAPPTVAPTAAFSARSRTPN